LDPDYVSALAAADHLLQAWQSGDVENGMVLLSSHAKQSAGSEAVAKFFSNSAPSAYEIERGKMVKRGRYEFPVVLVAGPSQRRARRRFSSFVVVNTGNNDWAVDKLP
jgi:nickel-dependent lactate racemase